MDFIAIKYDPHHCWNLTTELKQYRKPDKEFHDIVGRSRKHHR